MKKEFEHERRWGNKVLCVLFAGVYGIMGVVGNIISLLKKLDISR